MNQTIKAEYPASHLIDILKRFQARLENALDARLPSAATPPQRLHEAMRYTTLNGGKRLRAILVYAAGETVGANPSDLDTPACAVEMVHSYSLIHDDLPCMDDDDLRRGRPTCHKAFDEATAVLAGDALLTDAFKILAGDTGMRIDPARRLEMIDTLAQAIGSLGMAGGQAIDLAAVGKPLTLVELEDMHRRKTGALIRASVRMGALAADIVDENLMTALDSYALAIGLAFQIVDDVLDVEGNIETLGKTPGADQARHKPTYPALAGLDEAKTRARTLHKSALESLAPLGDNGALLAALADFIVERTQ